MVILYDIKNLPFDVDNFAIPNRCSVWESSTEDSVVSTSLFSASSLALTPNGLLDQGARYELKSIMFHFPQEDEYTEDYCRFSALLLAFERTNARAE
jgi:hypothetical protein